jgi:hypothetical protein
VGDLLGVRQGLTDPKPRSVPTPPHRRCSQRRQLYTTRHEQTVRQRMDPQTQESKAVDSRPKTGSTQWPPPGARAQRRTGHPKKGEGYLHRCRSAPLPRGSGAPTFQRGAAAALDPSVRGPSSSPPHPCSRWSLVLRQGAVRTLQGRGTPGDPSGSRRTPRVIEPRPGAEPDGDPEPGMKE